MTHKEGAGHPSTSTTDEYIQQACEMVTVNWRVIIDEVARSLQINHGSAYQIIHYELGFHKACARWAPRELTAEQKRKGLEVCLFDRCNNEGEDFLSRIVTGDETIIDRVTIAFTYSEMNLVLMKLKYLKSYCVGDS
ncbi:histone-lysine N-methyltransferase SETMAR-like [Octopus bimaculoides]|uniref:histone-lysine N-methyltransferase SETMAR-like n=1 Tax=Octopus bimaculoides TaxID=37653 RepID=UPI00071DA848|nr:histone-lysine N-methyltransferase SETMAR-like [Octopus bimaculoides]|eukprot:XP_014778885.1 PREDICTED: histone-lysine N-methyltransferase SETMAR-like [Octopus bimaculoides]